MTANLCLATSSKARANLATGAFIYFAVPRVKPGLELAGRNCCADVGCLSIPKRKVRHDQLTSHAARVVFLADSLGGLHRLEAEAV
jgi:hypothetical protein